MKRVTTITVATVIIILLNIILAVFSQTVLDRSPEMDKHLECAGCRDHHHMVFGDDGKCIKCDGCKKCQVCEGTGRNSSNDTCSICNGTGKCYYCNGTGKS